MGGNSLFIYLPHGNDYKKVMNTLKEIYLFPNYQIKEALLFSILKILYKKIIQNK